VLNKEGRKEGEVVCKQIKNNKKVAPRCNVSHGATKSKKSEMNFARIFYGPDEPKDISVNDIWFKTKV